MNIERIGWADLDECDALNLLLSCLADRADERESDDYRHFNLDGAYRTLVTEKTEAKPSSLWNMTSNARTFSSYGT